MCSCGKTCSTEFQTCVAPGWRDIMHLRKSPCTYRSDAKASRTLQESLSSVHTNNVRRETHNATHTDIYMQAHVNPRSRVLDTCLLPDATYCQKLCCHQTPEKCKITETAPPCPMVVTQAPRVRVRMVFVAIFQQNLRTCGNSMFAREALQAPHQLSREGPCVYSNEV